MEKTMRTTKAMKFEDVKALLTGAPASYGTTVEQALAFLDHEIGQLAKKNINENRKPTKVQEENSQIKEQILKILLENPDGMTCTDFIKNVPEFADFTNQKVSALMRQLKLAGKVTSESVKGRAVFTLI